MLDSCTGAFDNRQDLIGIPIEAYVDRALNYCLAAVRAHSFGLSFNLYAAPPTLAVNGDAFYLRSDLVVPEGIPRPFSLASRAQSFVKMLVELRGRIQACTASGRPNATVSDCVKSENAPARLAEWASDEQAFLLYAHYELDDGQAGPRLPSESLLAPIQSSERAQLNKMLTEICDQTFDARVESNGTPIEPLMDKALNYCLGAIRGRGEGYGR